MDGLSSRFSFQVPEILSGMSAADGLCACKYPPTVALKRRAVVDTANPDCLVPMLIAPPFGFTALSQIRLVWWRFGCLPRV